MVFIVFTQPIPAENSCRFPIQSKPTQPMKFPAKCDQSQPNHGPGPNRCSSLIRRIVKRADGRANVDTVRSTTAARCGRSDGTSCWRTSRRPGWRRCERVRARARTAGCQPLRRRGWDQPAARPRYTAASWQRTRRRSSPAVLPPSDGCGWWRRGTVPPSGRGSVGQLPGDDGAPRGRWWPCRGRRWPPPRRRCRRPRQPCTPPRVGLRLPSSGRCCSCCCCCRGRAPAALTRPGCRPRGCSGCCWSVPACLESSSECRRRRRRRRPERTATSRRRRPAAVRRVRHVPLRDPVRRGWRSCWPLVVGPWWSWTALTTSRRRRHRDCGRWARSWRWWRWSDRRRSTEGGTRRRHAARMKSANSPRSRPRELATSATNNIVQ